MSFQERQKTKNHSDQQGNHLKASVRYPVHSRLSDLQPGGVVVVTSSCSDSIVSAVHTRKTAFLNSTVFKSFHCGERFRNDPFSDRCSVDGSRIRNKTVSFSFENGVVWTEPQSVCPLSCVLTVEWSTARWCCCGDSSFSDSSIVFTVHTRKTAFSNSTVFK